MADVIPEIEKTNLTIRELWEFLHYDEGIPVSLRQLERAVWAEEIKPTKLSNNNYYSKQDGIDWIKGQKGKRRKTSKSVASN
ncbi:hypothetical protein [Mycolicibacterium frederiksbergense]|uniref:hypothetical protein n=1 Tax=Mycolicibacterium frederiksbergense TaxID=117567 RepID=UPI00399B264C